MTAQRDPERMVEGSLGDDALLDALRVARAHAPTEAQLEALALKVGVATAATAAGASGTGAMAKLQALWAKLGAAKLTLAVAIAGGAAYLGLRSSAVHEAPPRAIETPAMRDERDERAPAIAPTPTPAPTRAASDVPALQRGEPRAEQPEKPAERSAVPERRRAAERMRVATRLRAVTPAGEATAAPAAAPAPAPALEPEPREAPPEETYKPASELELLRRAQRLIARDPEGALAAIEEHTAAYPRGAFAQERDALAIDALRRLGRRAEWRARARAFLDRYPGSPHSERIRSWLQ